VTVPEPNPTVLRYPQDAGECWVTSLYAADGTMTGCRVTRADPLIIISEHIFESPPPFVESEGGWFAINAVNGTFRYRLAECCPEARGRWAWLHTCPEDWPLE